MNTNIFHLAQKIEVIDRRPKSKEDRFFYSRVEDMDKAALSIAIPYVGGEFMYLYPGERFDARVTTGEAAFYFESGLIAVERDPIPLWRVAWPEDVKKTQMRSYVRLNINLGVKVEFGERILINTLTRDISGGGIQFVLATPLSLGAKTKIVLPLNDKMMVEAKGEVVRVTAQPGENGKYGIGVKFVAIDERSRDGIIKYIFRKQVERRMKGLEQAI
ncbi:MAG: PilZ domain-containing protein [Negativicutes bacterium]|nr:PilZ domain-containing protein [Negativicutes bacterium]